MEVVIVVTEIVLALIWLQQGIMNYGFWEGGKPQGGFVPIIFALVILIFALVITFRIFRHKLKINPFRFNRAAAIPVFSAVGGVILIQLFGIAPAVFLFNVIWMRWLSKYSWTRSLLVSLIFTAFVYGVFRLWLRVPFPTGVIMELI